MRSFSSSWKPSQHYFGASQAVGNLLNIYKPSSQALEKLLDTFDGFLFLSVKLFLKFS
jgi:hypothetical protein